MKPLRCTLFAILMLCLSMVHAKALLGGPEILILVPPLSQVALPGSDVTFSVVATGPGTLTYQWRHGSTTIPGATNSTLTLNNVHIQDAGVYVVRVFRGTQGIDSLPAILTVAGISVQDLMGPVLKCLSPPTSFVRTPTNYFSFAGAASDDVGLATFSYQHNGGAWSQLPAGTRWSFDSPLEPGTNEFLIQATDLLGNTSATQRIVIFHSVSQPLQLTISGQGAVVGATNGQGLDIGRSYSLAATAKAGNYFSNWIADGVAVSGPVLSFVMRSNTVIHANFVANSFLGLQGIYTGLFYDRNLPTHASSGFVTFKLTDQGAFSGKVTLAGVPYAMSGRFDLDLRANAVINRPWPNLPLRVELQLASGSDQVTGWLHDGIQAVPLDAYRATFHATLNPATNFAGKYTMIFSGGTDPTSSPFGHGHGVVTVTTAGGVQFKGLLAEGSPVAAKALLASNGQWAFYVPLYRGQGSLFGWMTLAPSHTNDVQGLLLWTKPEVGGMFYPAGFIDEQVASGSRYVIPPSGTSVLSLSNAVVVLDGGNLNSALQDDLVLILNKVIPAPPNIHKLAITVSASSGLLSGSFLNPQTLKLSPIKGVLLQKQNVAAGYFLGTNQSGSMFLSAP